MITDEILSKERYVSKFMTDQNANHVIQKLIERGYSESLSKFKERYLRENNENDKKFLLECRTKLTPIIEKFSRHTYEYSIHALGCRVIQKLLECFPPSMLKESIFNEIMEHIEDLTLDK